MANWMLNKTLPGSNENSWNQIIKKGFCELLQYFSFTYIVLFIWVTIIGQYFILKKIISTLCLQNFKSCYLIFGNTFVLVSLT